MKKSNGMQIGAVLAQFVAVEHSIWASSKREYP